MVFKKIEPSLELKGLIDCYWVIESEDETPIKQKIIPDGFPELIFHYGDAYRIQIGKNWELQSKALVAGQIKKHFYLENSGRSGVFGIKLMPAALTHLFGLFMNELTDKVVSIEQLNVDPLKSLAAEIKKCQSYKEMISVAENMLQSRAKEIHIKDQVIDKIIASIFNTNGRITISELQKEFFITERQLQRLFQKYIGLSPKFYCRIIRFNYIFQIAKEKKLSWLEVTHFSGYFDQSHFIRDFKEFTGEEPSSYLFDAVDMANFFLRRQ
jgi:AraC-like DNA-binding protein